MGKKSKRNRSNKSKQKQENIPSTPNKKEEENINKNNDELQNNNVPPSLRSKEKVEEETIDNLKFEDPYEDVFIEEEETMVVSDEEQQQEEYKTRTVNLEEEKEEQEKIQSWTPLNNEQKNDNEEIEITPEAYKLYYNLTTEWPCLSFDIINDNLGYNRKKFPHSLTAVIGTQADYDRNNKITVLKLNDLGKMKNDNEEEEDSDDDDDNSDSDSDSDDEDHEPTLEYYSMKHDGGVNRLRVLQPTPEQQQQQQIDQVIVSTWSSKGIVNLYNVSPLVQKFDMSNYKPSGNKGRDANRPFFVYSGHSTEGYAMSFNKKEYGTLATGDCSGAIHIWNYHNNNNSYYYDQNSWSVEPYYKSEYSIEDIQWSPTENTVLCSAECNGYVNIYDTRCKGRSMLHTLISPNYKDINVLSWNEKVTNLLATGTDDGVFSVWDLRTFSSAGKNNDSLKPLARFQPCKKPITSLEWHPTDESMIIVSDEDTTYVYDLSVEVDDDEQVNKQDDNNLDVPPQMLFMHCGNQMTKEVHWHNQISSMVMTTSLNGFNVFIPSNL